jgi:hypothetical protein
LKAYTFDLGYYGNVPDLIWKRPETYSLERAEHYINFEIFERAMGKDPDWIPSREAFFRKYSVPENAGRAPWRVSELFSELEAVKQSLASSGAQKQVQFEAQKKWLMLAGVLGHYVTDLSQPLHVTENHDGQLTAQSGLHVIFESDYVEELHPEIASKILQASKKEHSKLLKQLEKKPRPQVFSLCLDLIRESLKERDELLKTDKRVGRSSTALASKAHEEMLVRTMSRGAAYLAVIWSRALGPRFDTEKFFQFDESPAYIRSSSSLMDSKVLNNELKKETPDVL